MIRARGAGCSARATTARHGCPPIAGRSSAARLHSPSARLTPTICFWGPKAVCCARETEGGAGPSKRHLSCSVPSLRWPSPRMGSGHWLRPVSGSFAMRPRTTGCRSPLLRAPRRREPSFAVGRTVASIWLAGPDCFAAMTGVRRGRAPPTASPRARDRTSRGGRLTRNPIRRRPGRDLGECRWRSNLGEPGSRDFPHQCRCHRCWTRNTRRDYGPREATECSGAMTPARAGKASGSRFPSRTPLCMESLRARKWSSSRPTAGSTGPPTAGKAGR